MNNNIEFKFNSFSGLATLFEYAGLLKSVDVKYIDNKLTHYIGLKSKEDIERFIGYIPNWQVDCFENVLSIAKALFYCDYKELNPSDINNLMGLLVALGEIGSYLTNETMGMSKDNTFPKRNVMPAGV